MEFITGLKQQEEAELEDLLKAEEGRRKDRYGTF